MPQSLYVSSFLFCELYCLENQVILTLKLQWRFLGRLRGFHLNAKNFYSLVFFRKPTQKLYPVGFLLSLPLQNDVQKLSLGDIFCCYCLIYEIITPFLRLLSKVVIKERLCCRVRRNEGVMKSGGKSQPRFLTAFWFPYMLVLSGFLHRY